MSLKVFPRTDIAQRNRSNNCFSELRKRVQGVIFNMIPFYIFRTRARARTIYTCHITRLTGVMKEK